MPKYVIEREIPGVGKMTPEELKAISVKSCLVMRQIGPEIQWVESYVTNDKLYCVYIAPNISTIQRHADVGGFPANRISQVKWVAQSFSLLKLCGFSPVFKSRTAESERRRLCATRLAHTSAFLIAVSLVCAAAAGAVQPAKSTQAEHAAKPPFSLTISAKPDVFKVGSPMPINVVLKNTSSHPINLVRLSLPNYKADIRDGQGALVKAKPLAEKLPDGRVRLRHAASSAMIVRIDPGKIGSNLFNFYDLTNDYELTKPGKYTVQLLRYDYETKTWVRSNTISIVVLPK